MNFTNILLQANPQPEGFNWQFILMMALIFGVMYFLMIRPQQKRQKELARFRKELKKDDKVITAGGIYASIKQVDETTVLLEVDSNVTLRIDKSMIMRDPSDFVQK
ncbi:MAG: preprotein translocase subunit YajC [Rikenellaceae bacterium]